MWHPVGPHPPSVYWRRRLVLLLVVLVAAIALGSTLGGSATPAGTSAAAPGQTPTPTASLSTPTPVTTTATPPPSPSPAASSAEPVDCAANVLTVTAATDAETYPAGSTPELTLTVRNTGIAPCRTDLGSAQLELRVLSGQDRVWSSDDCSPGGDPNPTVLPAGGQFTTSLQWPRVRSAPSCPGGEPAAQPGTYRLYARLGDRLSAPAVFHLA